MYTTTLEYNSYKPKTEEEEAHRELRNAFLSHSRKSMSKTIAQY
jgi:hypothetical protein